MFWITLPFGDTRAVVHKHEQPNPALVVEKLPDGEGILHLIDGKLIRLHPNVSGDGKPSLLENLKEENKILKAQLQAQTERSDFIEDCIAEMATVVYGGE